MGSEEDPAVYGFEDDDESFEEDLNHLPNNDEDDSTSSSNLAAVTIAIPPDPKQIPVVEEKEKKPSAIDDSRRLFQRLWTDEDEIELLQGFLDYTTLRLANPSSHPHHHDTTAFYDQIKSKLQLDFNKNQLVEKLRRLKKKYRNVLTKISSGKEYLFKSPHDQATFDISRKIWTETPQIAPQPNLPLSVVAVEDDDENHDEKLPTVSRKRSRVKMEEKSTPSPVPAPNLMEDTLKSCLSPLFKDLIQTFNVSKNVSRQFNINSPMPFAFGASPAISFTADDMVDEKWRKQHILELEVYSKRLELVQEQVKSQLEELRSMDN